MIRFLRGGGVVRRVTLVGACVALLAGCSDSPETMLASARDYMARNDLSAASIQLKNALQQDGKLAEARYLLGSVNLRQGNVVGAEKELRRAAELGFSGAEVTPLLARTMVQLGEFDRVLSEFEGRQVGERSADARLLAAVGDAHLGKREYDKARTAFDSALALQGTEPAAMLGRARSKFIAGDLDGAFADASEVVANPNAGDVLADAHALRAEIWQARGDSGQALAELDAAIKVRPEAIGYHFAAITLESSGEVADKASARLDRLVKIAPKHPLTQYLQAMFEQRKGNLTSAREHIAETVRLMPDYLPGRLLAGMIHTGLREHVLAQEHLRAVVGRAPRHEGARRALALSLLDSGEPQQGLETLEPLLDAPSPDVATLQLAGRIHVALGESEQAADAFEKVVAAKPEDARTRTQLGIARLLEGDLEEGVDELQAASDLTSSEGEADVALILINVRRGKFDAAMAAQQELERKRPEDPRTHALKGGILVAKRDLPGARAAFEKALSLKGDFLPAAISLSRLDLAEKRRDDALQRFESVIAANPAGVDAYLLLSGLILNTGGTPDASRAVLDRAAKANPQSPAPRLALVAHTLRFGDKKQAVAAAQELTAAYPGDARAHRMLGRAWVAAGDFPQAVAAFSRQASLLPRSAPALLELAEAQRLNKDLAASEQSLRKALALKPDYLDAQQRLSGLLAATERAAQALEIARSVQKQRPKSAVGWGLEGDIHVSAKSWGAAQQAFRKAFDLQPTPQGLIKLHAVQKLGGKPAEATKTVAEWLKSQPKDVVVRNYLAEGALAEGRLNDAEKIYREMDTIRPDNPMVINNLAWLAGKRGDAGAIALAERALSLAPGNPAVLDTLGVLQVAGGQGEEGLANLRKAVEIAPDKPGLRTNLAKAYAQLGRKDEARKELDAALAQLPGDSPQRKAVQEIKDKL